MGDQPYEFKYPAGYAPGQLAFNNNAEMSRLLSLFGGPIMQNLVGHGNFMPHMAPSQGPIDQYMARQYQQQVNASTFYMSGAGNQDVANRLLAMRTGFTEAPASNINKAQAEQFAAIINNPATKAVAGALIGPENLEAMLHGRKGDVAALNQVANRIGFFRRDPSGGRRMDARSLEDFSRGVYAHLYDEGGNLDQIEKDAQAVTEADPVAYNNNDSIKALKKAAKMEDKTLVSDDEVVSRVTKRIAASELSDEDVTKTYKKYVSGDEKDITKQAEALTKFDNAIKELDQTVKSKSADKTGILQKDEVTVDKTTTQARENRLGQMNGFMAGQVGQLAEQMFQRGMLPQAIGAMTPAERVKLLGDESREADPETVTRLAREFGHRDLLAKDVEYANATETRQREILNTRMDDYRGKITGVFDAAKDYNAGRQTDVRQIEKMEGYDAVAGDVDAKRSAAAIQKYTGAVAAVREIFGDNGNPNAPMPALLAALDHLSQGASAQMNPKQIETALRSMQQTAKESGIGFEQMAAMSAQMGAMGDMLGISKSQTMHNQVNTMAMVKTMRDDGVFSRPLFGAMTQAEATQLVGQKMQAGEASDNSRTMSALAGIYKAGPDAFDKNSEFAKAMEAYNNPSSGGKYTFNGQEKNIFEIVGKGGPQALQHMFREAGGKDSQLSAAFMNPASQQFAQAGAGFQSQRYEMLRDINNMAISGTLATKLQDVAPGSALGKLDPGATADTTGAAITELILESSGMKQDEQIKHIQENMIPTLTAAFKKSGITDEKEAERLATEAATAYMGGDKAKQSGEIKQLIDQAGAFVYRESGMSMVQAGYLYAGGRPAKSAAEKRKSDAIAQRKTDAGLNFSSQPLARISDYLLATGEKGGKITADGMFAALTQAIPEAELRSRYAHGMEAGLNTIQSELNDLTITQPYIDQLAKDGDHATLKQLAGIDAATTVVSDADFAQRHLAKMTAALTDDKKVAEEYERITGKKDTALSIEEQRTRLMNNEQFRTEHARETLNSNEISQARLAEGALMRSGGQLRPVAGETPEQQKAREQKRENLQTMRRSFFEGADEATLTEGVAAAVDYFGIDETQTNDQGQSVTAELTELIRSHDPTDTKKDEKHKEALSNKVDQLITDSGFAFSDEQKANMRAVFEGQRTGAKIDYAGVLGEASAAAQVAQQIASATIDATNVTLHAGTVSGVPTTGGATPAAAGTPPADPAAKSASDAAAESPVASAIPGGSPAPPAAGEGSAPPDATTPAATTPAAPAATTPAATTPAAPAATTPTATTSAAAAATTPAAPAATTPAATTPAAPAATTPTATTSAAAAANSASAAAQHTAAATKTIAPATPLPPAGGGQAQELVLSGSLQITNLEAGVLEVTGKNKNFNPVPGGGASVAAT